MAVISGWSVKNKWNALFVIWSLQGVFALGQFLMSQGSPFVLSIEEVLLAGALLFWVVFNLFLIFSCSKKSAWFIKSLDLLKKPAVKDGIFIISTLFVFFRTCLAMTQALATRTAGFRFLGYVDRLSPLLDLMTLVMVESMALIVYFAVCESLENKGFLKSFSLKMAVVLVLLGFTALYISLTDMGIEPVYRGDWGRGLPAVPLLEWQVILACVLCIGMVIAESKPRLQKIPHLDIWIALVVWGLAAGIWLSQPIVPNSAALAPREPIFEIHPFSDPQTYDAYSQSILVGNGFENEIPPRPLYAVFLAFLHMLVGQNYSDVIVLQSMFFALFPVLLYFFGRELYGRPVGISIALLAILRDYTSNLVSPFTGNPSYSKLYLSEIPTAMFLILFLLVGIRWIKSGFPFSSGLFMGGILGVSMLIRAQVLVALPMLVVFAFIVMPRKLVPIIKGASLALFTMAVVISPWLWRNWKITGRLVFDNPISQIANLALRYNRVNNVDINVLPLAGETETEYNTRLTRLTNQAVDANPGGIVAGIAGSFLNHGINNILVFPLRNELADAGELWTPTEPFWEKWEGRPTSSQGILLVFYVFLFGLGVSVAWQRNGWLGLLPLGVNLVYNLSTSLALISGQRFMLTMDWSIYLYYMIGLFTLSGIFLFALGSGRSTILKWHEANIFSFYQGSHRGRWGQYALAGLLFLGIGISLPLSERVFPKAYPPITQDEALNRLMSSPVWEQSKVDKSCFQKMVVGNKLTAAQGRAIYPRYYGENDGEVFTDSAGYKAVDEARLVFQMIGQINQRVVFPMSETPDFFPDGSDVTLFFDAGGNIWFMLVEQGDRQRIFFSDTLGTGVCD